MDAALKEVGIPSSSDLREALQNSSDPMQAIEDFQNQNAMVLPSLRAALSLLDLHGIRRSTFHQCLIEELKEKLINKIRNLGDSEDEQVCKQLQQIVAKSWPIVRIPVLQPIVMAALKQLGSRTEPKILNEIVNSPDLYAVAPVELKRAVWITDEERFGEEIYPLLSEYTKWCDDVLSSTDCVLTQNPKTRREPLTEVVKMLGDNIQLYDQTLTLLRSLYVRTKSPHYCTLRGQLLMALHDNDRSLIVSRDPCHKFAWCVDACVRERYVSDKRCAELIAFVDSVRRGHEDVIADLALVLADPYCLHSLASTVLTVLNSQLQSCSLPRDDNHILSLIRLLFLAMNAWRLLSEEETPVVNPDPSIIVHFLPMLQIVCADDEFRLLKSKHLHSNVHPDSIPIVLVKAANAEPLCSLFLLHLAVFQAERQDSQGAARTVCILSKCGVDCFRASWLHVLTCALAKNNDILACDRRFQQIVDDFYLTKKDAGADFEHVIKQLCALLLKVGHRAPSNRLVEVMEVVLPKADPKIKEQLETLLKSKVSVTETVEPKSPTV